MRRREVGGETRGELRGESVNLASVVPWKHRYEDPYCTLVTKSYISKDGDGYVNVGTMPRKRVRKTQRSQSDLSNYAAAYQDVKLTNSNGRVKLGDEFRDGRPSTAANNRNIDDRYVKAVLAVDLIQFDRGSKNGPRHLVQCHTYQIQGRASNLVWDIVKSDQTWIYCYDLKTKQQSTVWVYRDEPKPTKVTCERSASKGVCIFRSFYLEDAVVAEQVHLDLISLEEILLRGSIQHSPLRMDGTLPENGRI
ncbi:hypothetical protein EVAR_90046_1 [Eumeta japonica]|uniref:Uncharacterized protein n=1 Tax=Eumeta variegata TaxID=151549 RepID=A0A4C1WVV6_EUMVA|nr:hypothetical protein EVAR_90046_1 [Eumeta japonica]